MVQFFFARSLSTTMEQVGDPVNVIFLSYLKDLQINQMQMKKSGW